jgi:hypothetical protein
VLEKHQGTSEKVFQQKNKPHLQYKEAPVRVAHGFPHFPLVSFGKVNNFRQN